MVTFKKPIGSVSVSGHKFIGAPVPCGVVITRQRYIDALSSNVEYLNSRCAFLSEAGTGLALAESGSTGVQYRSFGLSRSCGISGWDTDIGLNQALINKLLVAPCRDATIMGSRNGHAPIYMWYTLTRKGYQGMRKDVERCLRNAHLLKVHAAPPPILEYYDLR